MASLDISEDMVESRLHKTAATNSLDFDGLLQPPLQLHEDLKEGCGGQLWPAGMVLAKYLLRSPQIDELKCKKSMVELGAGGGLVGLALAMSLHYGGDHDRLPHVRITDQEQLLALMHHNIDLNQLPPELVTASILDWGTNTDIAQPDVLLAAECVYFEPAFPILLETMKQLIGPSTVCWFCFKKRRRADLRFVKDAKKIFRVEEVMDDPDRAIWSRESLFFYKITAKPY